MERVESSLKGVDFNVIVTAYLMNLEKYVKYGVGRWRLIGDGRGVSA
jgi:hypothetical protein